MLTACVTITIAATLSSYAGVAEVLHTEKPRCDFPAFLQTSTSKSWLLNHSDTIVTYYVSGGMMTAYDCRKDNRECSQFNRICWKSFSDDRVLVKHLESDFHNRFLCMQFVERSQSVIQIRISHTRNGHVGKFLCDVDKLTLDPWPWISEEHSASASSSCPFVGGYNFELFTFSNRRLYKVQTKCTQAIPPVRVESDCADGEGMTFRFRSSDCLHDEGNFDVVQNAKCIATWTEGGDSFGVLRKNADRYFWCVRVVFGESKEVSRVIVFLDLICDHTMNFTLTKRYLELDKLEKRKVTHMCTDEFYGCEVMNELCTVLSDLCAKTCGSCNSSKQAMPCEFPYRIQGSWLLSQLRKDVVIEISSKVIQRQRSGAYECVTFEDNPRPLRRVLLRRFTNGCYPRFMCLHYDVPAPSVMRFRVGNMLTWPTKLSDDAICDKEHFMTYPDVRNSLEAPYFRPFESLIKLKTNFRSVACNFPWTLSNSLTVYDDYGYTSCLIHGSYTSPNQLLFGDIRNGSVTISKRYTCVGSLTFIDSYKSVITVTHGSSVEYLCWILVSDNFLLIVAPSACNTLTARFIMSRREQFEKYLIQSFYIMSSNASTVCDDYYDEHYAYKPRWHFDNLTYDNNTCVQKRSHIPEVAAIMLLHFVSIT